MNDKIGIALGAYIERSATRACRHHTEQQVPQRGGSARAGVDGR